MSFDYCPTCQRGTDHIEGWCVLHPRTDEERPDTTPYPGCALPVGMKAQFWRSYFVTNLHMRLEVRSPVDCLLRELEIAEAELVTFQADQRPHRPGYCWWCGAHRLRPLYVMIEDREVVVCNETCQAALTQALG